MAELLAAEDDPLLKKQKNAKCGVKKNIFSTIFEIELAQTNHLFP